MEIRIYKGLNIGKLGSKVEKICKSLAEGDFRTADVKKMNNGFYRAKLDDTNRLLFNISTYQQQRYIFILEVIHNHAYEKSRFLNGARIDENKLSSVYEIDDVNDCDTTTISYINRDEKSFHIQDKIISFDQNQEEILHLPTPGIIIGSAGSGKTALTLEKLKILEGNVLYTSLSPYLVENASQLYSSFGYENAKQEVAFLSFYEYLSSIDMPFGKEADYVSFDRWIARYAQSHKIKDTYRVYEEIKGVITGSSVANAFLSKEEYLSLGIKQSIFNGTEREQTYDLFLKYKNWIAEGEYFDSNIHSYELLNKVLPVYDYVIIDEVQDLTNVQLLLILKSLHKQGNFIICGDSNQIVHPNFFSWSQVKTLFYNLELKSDIITRILNVNFRNTPAVTAIANRLLLIKNTRFGSIDKESTYLVIPNSDSNGSVEYLENTAKINAELNSKTSMSTKFAVLVLRNEDKAAAKRFYNTPLLFSIQEAKGLEYENIILFNTISSYDKEFRELTNGVTENDLLPENLNFSRSRDKYDKSLEEYKFYVNSLYVGITRAVKNLYIIEDNKKHALLELLGLVHIKQQSSLTDQTSSKDEWQQEARRLEMQGKQEQADAIREQILQLKPVPWSVTRRMDFAELKENALNPEIYNRKAKDRFYCYVVYYNKLQYRKPLAQLKYKAAENWLLYNYAEINTGQVNLYIVDNLKSLKPYFLQYGVDYRTEVNFTPLMICLMSSALKTIDYLLENGARTDLVNNVGNDAFRIALQTCFYVHRQTEPILNTFYHRLVPESLRLRINNKLIKINNYQAEFLILNTMLANLHSKLWEAKPDHESDHPIGENDKTIHNDVSTRSVKPGFTAIDLFDFFGNFSDHVLPQYRRKKTYISSILSKNELHRKGPGNHSLFLRMGSGLYLPHPLMEIQIDGTWVNIYDNCDIDAMVGLPEMNFLKPCLDQIDAYRKKLTEDWKARV
ncbi:UvrD-helicase domain-containing protein [Pedobacter sp. AW31-3R]|uniref:UvrD-helicase domain-containing protein n=1 Tax=Pedobacter sp. AW31-3R TaxID=3445781 RepID=UPI003FA15C99